MNGKREMRISPHEEEAIRAFLSARERRTQPFKTRWRN